MEIYKFKNYEVIEETYGGPGYTPRFTIKYQDISIVMDYSDMFYADLRIDDYDNDFLVPIIIYKNDVQIGKIYRTLNNGCPYHDEDIIEMLACYTHIDDMEEIFRFIDECFE